MLERTQQNKITLCEQIATFFLFKGLYTSNINIITSSHLTTPFKSDSVTKSMSLSVFVRSVNIIQVNKMCYERSLPTFETSEKVIVVTKPYESDKN